MKQVHRQGSFFSITRDTDDIKTLLITMKSQVTDAELLSTLEYVFEMAENIESAALSLFEDEQNHGDE